ncbi:MAG: glycosyltransferase [Taibaiella sp.]|nr:glycosyltransferase [Taibaiella sp.]
MMSIKADLVYFSHSRDVNWPYGNTYQSELSVQGLHNTLSKLVSETTAEWIVFWDYTLGEPDTGLIQQLITQPVGVFHAGLRLGTHGLPDVLNYVHPTWMYNADGGNEITHSNFRMSFRACIIRTEVLKKIGLPSTHYSSLEMVAVAYGYNVLKQGGIIRYHSGLLQKDATDKVAVSLKDEWVFARQFFTKKWLRWILFNKPGFIANLSAWQKTKSVKYVNAKPTLHPSLATNTPVQHKTVSVLAPTLDRYPYLEEELRELNEQTILPHEVLITDQTDENRRQQLEFSKYPNITVRYFPQNEKGQCLAWNKLIEEATGEYIFFFGDDAYDIKPQLIEKMLQTMQRYDADMVASNVREKGIVYGAANYHYYMSDTFPITLIKKSVVMEAGKMDMFFNRNVKADHDLAMRCHLNGALMIYDPSAEIGHHRAPSGGLRAHNARVITNFMTKNTITKVLNPGPSEIFIAKKYYSEKQLVSHVRIKYMNQLIINGNILKKIARLLFLLYKIPALRKAYKANMAMVDEEMERRKADK